MSTERSSDPEATTGDPPTLGPGAASPTPPSNAAGSFTLQPGGRPLPDFELVRKLGAGGFGEVWHARGPGGIDVALKFIRLDGGGSQLELRALEMMKSIRHPNLVSLFGAWHQNGMLILAMELCDRSLQDRLNEVRAQNQPGIPIAELLEYMRDAARGIDLLNDKHIQHRDIKPLNLLVVENALKVSDFGLAKALEMSVASNTGSMTPNYAAPECFKGEIARQSDQYSFAVTYYQLRTGKLPFEGSMEKVMFGHVSGEADWSRIPPEERAAVARALAKEPGQRHASCQAFVLALADARGAALRHQDTAPHTQADDQRTITRPAEGTIGMSRRRPWVAAMLLLLALACVVLVAGALHWFSGDKGGDPDATATKAKDAPPDKTEEANSPTFPKKKEVKSLAESPKEVAVDLGGGATMEFVLIPPGKFWMGSPKDEAKRNPIERDFDAEELHEVEITKPFYLAKYPTTQQQYEALTGKAPSHFSATGIGKKNAEGMDARRFPVETVSWNDAKAFCALLTNKDTKRRKFSLPSEAQWEYACRAETRTVFHFGDVLHGDKANCNGNYPYGTETKGAYKARTCEIGSYPPNAWGLYDMHGNVWQWCEDYYGPYQDLGNKDPLRTKLHKLDARVMRGGSWDDAARNCRAAYRIRYASGYADSAGGFRACLHLD